MTTTQQPTVYELDTVTKVCIHKTVDVVGRRGACPFCKHGTLRIGNNADGQVFFHCFACGASGQANVVTAR